MKCCASPKLFLLLQSKTYHKRQQQNVYILQHAEVVISIETESNNFIIMNAISG